MRNDKLDFRETIRSLLQISNISVIMIIFYLMELQKYRQGVLKDENLHFTFPTHILCEQ